MIPRYVVEINVVLPGKTGIWQKLARNKNSNMVKIRMWQKLASGMWQKIYE
jgi:hypothetical protein